jgi:hypothetical protein
VTAVLADDWQENRQTCVDVLCAYLRMPYKPDPGQDGPAPQQLAFQSVGDHVIHLIVSPSELGNCMIADRWSSRAALSRSPTSRMATAASRQLAIGNDAVGGIAHYP